MASPSSSSSNNRRRGGAKVVGEAELGHRVDEPGRHVQPEAPLAGAVVVGEGMVVVVETLAHCQHRHKPVLSGADVLVIGLHPKHVSCRVDQPGEVKD